MEQEGVEVLAPSGNLINSGEEFPILDENMITDKRTIVDSNLADIRASSFLVVTNVNGYIGKAVSF